MYVPPGGSDSKADAFWNRPAASAISSASCPTRCFDSSTITGIEIDPLTAHIAKALYPDADIRNQPFEKTKLADGFYDLADFQYAVR